MQLRAISSLLLILLLSLALPSGASSASLRFVDLDGDGFNDNAPDGDGNGIPDEFEAGYVAPTEEGPATGIFSGLQSDESPTPILPETNKEQFGRLSFCIRSICEERSVFDADFGSGLSVNVSAGGCAGGVCR